MSAPTEFVPGVTLGRSGYILPPADRLAFKIAHLDALLSTLTGAGDPEDADFFGMNETIQHTLLELASSLAEEIHELHDQVRCQQAQKPPQPREGGAA